MKAIIDGVYMHGSWRSDALPLIGRMKIFFSNTVVVQTSFSTNLFFKVGDTRDEHGTPRGSENLPDLLLVSPDSISF